MDNGTIALILTAVSVVSGAAYAWVNRADRRAERTVDANEVLRQNAIALMETARVSQVDALEQRLVILEKEVLECKAREAEFVRDNARLRRDNEELMRRLFFKETGGTP